MEDGIIRPNLSSKGNWKNQEIIENIWDFQYQETKCETKCEIGLKLVEKSIYKRKIYGGYELVMYARFFLNLCK